MWLLLFYCLQFEFEFEFEVLLLEREYFPFVCSKYPSKRMI